LKHADLKTTWFHKFCKLLTARCHKDELPARLAHVAMVIFNYDRCFERYIAHYLKDYYAISQEEAETLARTVEIYHPYGTVGELPQAGKKGGTPFGLEPAPSDLLNIASNLKTFTEADKATDIDAIRKLIAAAPRVVFLGFGFLPLNMDLLIAKPERATQSHPGNFYGTALSMSEPNVEAITNSLITRLRGIHGTIQLVDRTAGAMMEWFSQRLRFD